MRNRKKDNAEPELEVFGEVLREIQEQEEPQEQEPCLNAQK